MRVLERQGMPHRGSLQDRVAQEMLYRERKRTVMQQMYLGRILAAGLNLPEKLTSLWNEMLSLEVHQDGYLPKVIDAKERALTELRMSGKKKMEENSGLMQKLDKLEVKHEANMLPLSPMELEERRRRIRSRHLKRTVK